MPSGASFLTGPTSGHPASLTHLGDTTMVAAMVRVEAALALAQADLGFISHRLAQEVAAFAPDRVPSDALARGGAASGVQVPALVQTLRAQFSPATADAVHYGAASQDVVNTAMCLCFADAVEDISVATEAVIDRLQALWRAEEQRLMRAPTRGQVATSIAFGLRVAQWAQPVVALEAELASLKEKALRVQLSGASGCCSVFGLHGVDLARHLANLRDLSAGPPWHNDRSGIRRLAPWLSRPTAALARVGRDVSLSARSEIGKLPLTTAGSSSTMPHKANPVLAKALHAHGPTADACEAELSASTMHAVEQDVVNWPVEWAIMHRLFETAGAALGHVDRLLDVVRPDRKAIHARVKQNPAVRAGSAVFALMPRIERMAAGRIVSDCLQTGTDMGEALTGAGINDAQAALSDTAWFESARDTATAVFAARKAWTENG